MTRDELEAVIWQEADLLTYASPTAVRAAAMDRILAAADDYARHTGGITAERRAVLAIRRPVKAETKARYERARRAARRAAS